MDPVNPNPPGMNQGGEQNQPTRGRRSSRLLGKHVRSTEGEPEKPLQKKPRFQPETPKPGSSRSVQPGIDWVDPKLDARGRIMLPEACVESALQCRVDARAIKDLAIQVQFREPVYHKASSIAGMGVFADRNLRKHEFIGFYKGRLTKHIPVHKKARDHYKSNRKNKEHLLPPKLYVTWYEDNGIHFLTTPDTHILWSGVKVYRTSVELGIDGLIKGNDLAYLNHSEHPNVMALATVTQAQFCVSGSQLCLKSKYSGNDLLLLVVAIEDIPKGSELTFNYDRTEVSKEFSKVGYDIFPEPDLYTEILGDRVHFKYGAEQKRALKAREAEREARRLAEGAFGSVLPLPPELHLNSEQRQLATDWCQFRTKAHKQVIDMMHQRDEVMLKLYIWLNYFHYSHSPSNTYICLQRNHLTDLFGFNNVSDLRHYIRTNFSSELASRINYQQNTGSKTSGVVPQERARKSTDLLDRVYSGRDNPEEAMKQYLVNCIYNTSRQDDHPSNMFSSAEKVLSTRAGILGKPQGYWVMSRLYAFMIDHGLFRSKSDQALYVPLSYLAACFRKPTEGHGPEQGKRVLELYVTQWLKQKKPLKNLQSELNKYRVYNPYSESDHWQESDLLKLTATRLYYRVTPRDSHGLMHEKLECDVRTWLSSPKTDPSGKQALERAKAVLQQKPELFKWVVFYMRKLQTHSIYEINEKARNFREGRARILSEDIRECIYQCTEDYSLDERAKLLEGYIYLAIGEIKKYEVKHPGLKVPDSLFPEHFRTQLRKELREHMAASQYYFQKKWIKLIEQSRSEALLRILVTEYMARKTPSQAVISLNSSNVCTPSELADGVKAQWTSKMIKSFVSSD